STVTKRNVEEASATRMMVARRGSTAGPAVVIETILCTLGAKRSRHRPHLHCDRSQPTGLDSSTMEGPTTGDAEAPAPAQAPPSSTARRARKTPKRPTIRDVAAVAGVSRGTVSRVINGGHWVSPEARTAVDAAIKRTGYRANEHARSLVTGRSNSIAFLLTE